MNRDPLKNGTILRFPDGQEHEVLGLIGSGGSALLYETRILGSELFAAVKEIYPARGYVRKNGRICPSVALPRRERELSRRKQSLEELETRLSQKASRKNHQVLFLQPPVWHKADLLLPDGTVFSDVENTYVRMDSLAEKGIPLAQFASGGAHTLDASLAVMETVLDAYAALHEDGFLHGDCQMSNLFLLKAGQGGTNPGTACIIDFGSARELDKDGQTAPITDELFATDGYCAPELMFPTGETPRLSAAADVWSLGFLLLNLLVDRQLDGIDCITKFLLLHPEEKFPTYDELDALGCTPAQQNLLLYLLRRTLASNPNDRFSNAGEMRNYLHKLIDCRKKVTTGELHSWLLWDAVWHHRQNNPALFQTEHVFPNSTLPPCQLRLNASHSRKKPEDVGLLLSDLADAGKNTYLYGTGGSGKSFSIAPQTASWMNTRKCLPLYLDLSAFTSEAIAACCGDIARVIPSLLAKQYFNRAELGESLDRLLSSGTSLHDHYYIRQSLGEDRLPTMFWSDITTFSLVLDNLHKVEKSALPAVVTSLNGLKERWPNVWTLVLGRAKNPISEHGVRHFSYKAKETRARNGIFSRLDQKLTNALLDYDDFDYRELDSVDEEENDSCTNQTTSLGLTLNFEHVELLPLTSEEILKQINAVRNKSLTLEEGAILLKQAPALKLPMFLILYLERLALNPQYNLPSNSMELMHSFFALQEYRGGGPEFHDLLWEQLPWIARQFTRRAPHTMFKYLLETPDFEPELISFWLKQRFGQDADLDGFFHRSVDELAVLERSSTGTYHFVHACYQEYFAALLSSNAIQQAIVRKSSEPLKTASWRWSEKMTAHALELSCLTIRDGQTVRMRSETEILTELGRVLVPLSRRELGPLYKVVVSIWVSCFLSRSILAAHPDPELLQTWRKIHTKSAPCMFLLLSVFVAIPFTLLLQSKRFFWRILCSFTEDGKAEFCLYHQYQSGEGGRHINLKKAKTYLCASAQKGYPPALVALGERAEADREYDMARDMYEQAADKFYPQAKMHLAWMYYRGEGGPRDPRKGFELIQQAAESGYATAQHTCGELLEKRDPDKALYWYEKAASQGHEEAKIAVQRLRAAHKN